MPVPPFFNGTFTNGHNRSLLNSFSPAHTPTNAQDFVYEGSNPPLSGYREEDALPSPLQCMYSQTKLAFDHQLLAESSGALRVIVLRIANVVGGKAPYFKDQPLKFAEWLHKELTGSPDKATSPVRLWSDEVRSFLFVNDLVRVVWGLVSLDVKTSHVLNVGTFSYTPHTQIVISCK